MIDVNVDILGDDDGCLGENWVGGEKVGISSLSKKWVIRRQGQREPLARIYQVLELSSRLIKAWRAHFW